MSYTPPSGNAVDFDLAVYEPPASNLDFALGEDEPPPDPPASGTLRVPSVPSIPSIPSIGGEW